MNYKITLITPVYPDFIIQFLNANSDYQTLSYSELYSRFTKTRYGWSDFYKNHFQCLGNEACSIFSNIEPLQKAWARENNIQYSESKWQEEIVLAQVKLYGPDIIYLPDLYSFDPFFRKTLRNILKKVKIIGWRFAPTKDYSIFSDLDLLLTGNHDFVNRFKKHGTHTLYLPHGFEHSIAEEIECINNERDIDISFIGSTGAPDGIHSKRHELIMHMMNNTSMNLWTDSEEGKFYNLKSLTFLNKTTYIGYKALHKLISQNKQMQNLASKTPFIKRGKYIYDQSFPSFKTLFKNRVNSPVFGLEAYSILANSKIVFNKHIDVAGNNGGNVRLFESTGLGACLLTDHIANIKDFFEPDYEVVTYHSKEEAIDKYNYLINNEKERKKIADAGKLKTLSKHTILQRIETFNDYCLKLLH